MLSILASYAQEESLSASENQKWRVKRNFEEGIPWRFFMLGYRRENGKLAIVPEEAEIVRRTYREFLQGKSTNAIAAMLTEEGIPTPGKKTVWQRATVESILRNEKYKGSALLQKSFTVDFLNADILLPPAELNRKVRNMLHFFAELLRNHAVFRNQNGNLRPELFQRGRQCAHNIRQSARFYERDTFTCDKKNFQTQFLSVCNVFCFRYR